MARAARLARAVPRVDAQLTTMVLALALLALGLRDPTWPMRQSVYRHLLVFDITQSMNVVDDPSRGGSRLERATAWAIEAMTAFTCGSEVGVGLFTCHRCLVLFTPVEICEHYGDISTTVGSLDWRMAWAARSEVAKGLHSALEVAGSLGRRTSVIFFTDGHEAPPLHPAHRPRYDGVPGEIRGALAGVGGLQPLPIPKLDLDGGTGGFWQADDVMQVDAFSLGRNTSLSGERLGGIERSDLDARIAAGREHLSSLKQAYLRDLAVRLSLQYARIDGPDDLASLLRHPALGIERDAEVDARPLIGGLALVLIVSGYAVRAVFPRLGRAQIGWPFSSTSGTP